MFRLAIIQIGSSMFLLLFLIFDFYANIFLELSLLLIPSHFYQLPQWIYQT